MATRCFSPPESLRPRSPTMVSKPRGIGSTALSSLAISAQHSLIMRSFLGGTLNEF